MRESMGITSGGPRSMYHQSGKPPFPRTQESSSAASCLPAGRLTMERPAAYHSPGSRASPLAQGSSEYPGMHDIPSYDHMTSSGEPWSSTVSCAVPSTVSSPSSSGATDDLGSAYYPTSAPASLLDRSGLSSSMNSPTASCISGKLGYEDIKSGKSGVWRRGNGRAAGLIKKADLGCPQISVLPMPQTYQQPPPWNMYPMYYQGSQAL